MIDELRARLSRRSCSSDGLDVLLRLVMRVQLLLSPKGMITRVALVSACSFVCGVASVCDWVLADFDDPCNFVDVPLRELVEFQLLLVSE